MLPDAPTGRPEVGPDDADALVVRAPRDREALAALYGRHYDRVLRYCARRLGCQSWAEDATSEVFLTVARKLRGFRGRTEAEFVNWLYAIASRQAASLLRKHARRRRLFAEGVAGGQLGGDAVTEPDPPADFAALHAALVRLRPQHQAIIVLRFFEGCSHQRIADILKIKPVTARVRLNRALAQLRGMLPPDLLEEVNHVAV